jgi:hypothetical protein
MPVDLPKFPAIICTYRLSNDKLTVQAVIRNGKIIDADPVIRIFIGQPLDNLATWMRKLGPTELMLISTGTDTQKERNTYA